LVGGPGRGRGDIAPRHVGAAAFEREREESLLHIRGRLGTWAAATVLGSLFWASAAGAKPILMPTLAGAIQHAQATHRAITPPSPPCPESGLLPAPFSNCGLPELPAAGIPYLGNMAYWGGHVQVTPKVYLVYWGWGQPGAFPSTQKCAPVAITGGATLACDPDGAGARMADWVSQLGGTQWAGVQTQYYQTTSSGQKQFITNPSNVLAGIWVDDANPAAGLAKTSATNPAGSGNTYTDLAAEAQRAVAHFGVSDLVNADFVIAQPPNFTDPNALAQGYCAFHDYTQPTLQKGIYNGLTPGIAYTNMPYVLAINSAQLIGGTAVNVCGVNAVNSGASGKLDGISIVLGHEIEETVTDPGAEDIQGSLLHTTKLGGWYDPFDANENGDKCAWVGEPLVSGLPGEPQVLPIAGAMADIKGNRGTTFAVQSLWSNRSAAGLGYCAGAGNDLPVPSATSASHPTAKRSARHTSTKAHGARKRSRRAHRR
jgi:serine protease